MVDGGFSPSSAFAENVGTDTTDSTISSAKIKEHTFSEVFSYFPPESICSHEKRRINILNTSFEFLLFFVGGRVYFLCCPDSSVAEYRLESVVVCNHFNLR